MVWPLATGVKCEHDNSICRVQRPAAHAPLTTVCTLRHAQPLTAPPCSDRRSWRRATGSTACWATAWTTRTTPRTVSVRGGHDTARAYGWCIEDLGTPNVLMKQAGCSRGSTNGLEVQQRAVGPWDQVSGRRDALGCTALRLQYGVMSETHGLGDRTHAAFAGFSIRQGLAIAIRTTTPQLPRPRVTSPHRTHAATRGGVHMTHPLVRLPYRLCRTVHVQPASRSCTSPCPRRGAWRALTASRCSRWRRGSSTAWRTTTRARATAGATAGTADWATRCVGIGLRIGLRLYWGGSTAFLQLGQRRARLGTNCICVCPTSWLCTWHGERSSEGREKGAGSYAFHPAAPGYREARKSGAQAWITPVCSYSDHRRRADTQCVLARVYYSPTRYTHLQQDQDKPRKSLVTTLFPC